MSARILDEPVKKRCIVCGNLFECHTTTTVKAKLYCSDACRNVANAERQKELQAEKAYQEKIKAEDEAERKKKASRKKLGMTLEEINAAARAEGISYGQWMAKHANY